MKLLICVIATSAVLAYAYASYPVRVRGIYLTQPEEGHHSSLGVVNGVRHCGGKGRVVQWRVDGCSGEGTCRLEANGQNFPTEFEFVPSEDIDSLGLKFIVIDDGTAQNVYEQPIADSAVQGGETYIVHALGSANEKLKGRTLTTQYILYHVEDGHVETCVEADFELY